MNLFQVTLKDLTYILAVAEHRSFSKAAEACAVSQPALSKQIKTIEDNLNIKLFERNKRQVFLTEMGERFVEQTRKVLDETEKLMELTGGSQAPLSGMFRLGVIASSCPYLLPFFVGELKELFPQLQLVVKEGLTDQLVHLLKQGHLDAVIAATTFEDELLNYIPLYFEPFFLASSKNEASRYRSEVAVSEIDPHHLLLLEDGHCLKDQTLDLCALSESHLVANFRATSLETLLHMTAGGLGVSVIPALAVPRQSKLGDNLVFSRFKNQNNGRIMALYFRKSYPYRDNVKILGEFIKSHLPKTVDKL